jgi:DNA-binding transcriptional MerR regulator
VITRRPSRSSTGDDAAPSSPPQPAQADTAAHRTITDTSATRVSFAIDADDPTPGNGADPVVTKSTLAVVFLVSYCSPMEHDTEPLHIDTLAELAGVTRRTVRFYVQRGLLSGPDGAGRGATYRRSHLERLIRIRDLQSAGVPLNDIADILDGVATPPPAPRQPRGVHTVVFEIVPGVSLHVRAGALPDHVAAQVAALVAETLGATSLQPEPPVKEHP